MHIEKLTPNLYFNRFFKQSKDEKTQLNTTTDAISFEARVDKGLIRFYEANIDRMPVTVKNTIENLSDKTSKTPLQAQAAAFAALAGATTIGAIKDSFDEPLFNDLKDPSESKATRGILGVFRENKELLELCNQSILSSGENLTVWLVKKIFLEGKTLEEINKDFNTEVNSEFKQLYLQKEKNEEPIKSGTLKALGIKMPEFEYQQSLRYTREGYSDLVGDKISQVQKDFYASLPIEERTARARKSVEKFESWWNSMSRNEQLDIIAQQIDELEMLNRFNSSEFAKTKTRKNEKKPSNEIENNRSAESKNKVAITSTLSRDDLFKIWAGNNLKIFQANLTELDKRKIDIKRSQSRANWWKSMTAEERTDYINKLRIGAEPLRFAMIDAWNKNSDILIELSHTMKKNHFNKPLDIIYGTNEFNEFLSQVMTEFWTSNPDFAERLGETIRDSHDRIKTAINNGNFETLKKEISNSKNKREKEILNAIKNYRIVLTDEEYNAYPQHMRDFIDAYGKSKATDTKLLPVKYLRDYYAIIAEITPKEAVESWVKALKGEELSATDKSNLEEIRNIETTKLAIISRGLEAALAEALYKCTNDPEVYLFSHADCKRAIKQISSGEKNITLYSHKLNKNFDIPIINPDIDIKEIENLYDYYVEPLAEGGADSILDQFVEYNYDKIKTIQEKSELMELLRQYFETYGNSNAILFNNETSHSPEAKACFALKVLYNLPKEIDSESFTLKVKSVEDFQKEKQLNRINVLMRKKYNFLPIDAFNMYAYELNKVLRNSSQSDIDTFEKICCKPRKVSSDHSKIILIKRPSFSPTHKIFSLCLEQALADLIYESSGNEEIYAFQMEELLSFMEAIMLVKKFPMKEAQDFPSINLGTEPSFKLKYRIQPYQIEKRFREYYNEMVNYLNECATEKKNVSKEEILYVLNPDENKIRTDLLTKIRIENSISNNLFPI